MDEIKVEILNDTFCFIKKKNSYFILVYNSSATRNFFEENV